MRKPRKKDIEAQALSGDLIGGDPARIATAALELAKPVRTFVGFSGGFDSLVTTHWCMNNIPGCEVFHANTGIGIEATRVFVRETCAANGWPLTEIRAKEDCGQDYDAMVTERGFPGPGHHYKMFQRLKERCVEKLLRDSKRGRHDSILLLTGIRQDESDRRAGYHYTLLDWRGNILWANPFYYKTRQWFRAYIDLHGLKQNPVSEILGMSGECLCGAYAHPGELAKVKIVCPETYERIKALEARVREAGHGWGWEDAPPRDRHKQTRQMFMPMCVGCEKGEAPQRDVSA